MIVWHKNKNKFVVITMWRSYSLFLVAGIFHIRISEISLHKNNSHDRHIVMTTNLFLLYNMYVLPKK